MRLYSIIPFALLLLLNNCSNFGLMEKLENPGGSSTVGNIKTYIFTHDVVTLGDMSGLVNGGCSGNGLSRADCACHDKAVAAGLVKNQNAKFIAWLSDGSNDMKCRIQDRLGQTVCTLPTATIEWYNPLNQLVAGGYAQLFSGQLLANVNYAANGSGTPAGTNVYTGTLTDGSNNGGAAAVNCNNWTANISQTASGGTSGSMTSTWTTGGSPSCASSAYIICLGIR